MGRALILCGLALVARPVLQSLDSDVTVWTRAVRVHPSSAIAWLNLGQAQAVHGDDPRGAYQHALQASDPRVRLVAQLNAIVELASRGSWIQAQSELTALGSVSMPPGLAQWAGQIQAWIGRSSPCAGSC